MGSSLNLSLVYGIDINGCEDIWSFEEFDSDYNSDNYGLNVSWYDESSYDGFEEQFMKKLGEVRGVLSKRDWEISKQLGIDFDFYGQHDFFGKVLVIKESVKLYFNCVVSLDSLEYLSHPVDWDDKLINALRDVGLTPTKLPGWHVLGCYG